MLKIHTYYLYGGLATYSPHTLLQYTHCWKFSLTCEQKKSEISSYIGLRAGVPVMPHYTYNVHLHTLNVISRRLSSLLRVRFLNDTAHLEISPRHWMSS